MSCTGLQSVTIGNSVTNIVSGSFAYCSSLTSVTIPDSVTIIDNGVFNGCIELANITYEGTKAQWGNVALGTNWNSGIPATTVQCSDGTVNI